MIWYHDSVLDSTDDECSWFDSHQGHNNLCLVITIIIIEYFQTFISIVKGGSISHLIDDNVVHLGIECVEGY